MTPDLGFVPLRARCYPGLAERGAGAFADRIGKLALSLVGGMLVDQRGAGAAVAHPVYQLAKARALIGGKVFPACRRSWKWMPGRPTLATAGIHARR
jgi:hypothetical protein